MYAIQVIHKNDGPRLLWAEAEEPAMGPDDVLVDIQATTLNRADLSQAAGNYPPPAGAPPILGLDMAGTIAALGANVHGWTVGDRVCALLTGGGYAERTVVDHRMLLPVPAGWDWGEAIGDRAPLPGAVLAPCGERRHPPGHRPQLPRAGSPGRP